VRAPSSFYALLTWQQPLPSLIWLAQLAALASLYVVGGRLGLAVPQVGEHISLVWPPSGLAFAALFRYGSRLWPGVLIGAFMVTSGQGIAWPTALAIAAGNALAPSAVAALLQHFGLRRELDRRRDLLLFFLWAAGVMPLVTATNGVMWLWLADLLDAVPWPLSWLYWWLGDAAGVLLVAVPLLTIGRVDWTQAAQRQRAAWTAVGTAAIITIGLLPFSSWLHRDNTLSPLLFLPHLLLCWLAASRGLFVSSLAVLLISAFAATATAYGHGPFFDGQASQSLAMLWAYVCTLGAMPMLITALLGELSANDRRWQLALDSSNIGVAEWDSRVDEITLSPRWMSLLGHRARAWTTTPALLWSRVHAEDQPLLLKVLAPLQAGAVKTGPVEFRLQSSDEQWHWFQGNAIVAQRATDGTPQRVIATARDISEQRAAEDQKQLSAKLFQYLDEGLLITDAQFRVLDANPMFSQMTGYARQEVVGTVPALLRPGAPNTMEESQRLQMLDSVREHGSWRGEVHTRHRNGEPRTLQITVSAVKSPQGAARFHALAISDITQAHRQLEQLERQAHYDELTGLPNRTRFAQMMSEAMLTSEREGFLLTICYLDLDHFKPVNDQYGHDAGDRLLVELADRLRRSMRNWASGSDAVARLGGDEFVLLLRTATVEEGRQAVERILRNLSQPYTLGLGIPPVVVTSSIGATVYPLDHADADTLLRHADHAMYGAKQSGRNGYLFFDAEHDRRTEAQFEAISRVQEALDAEQFVLHFQPKVNMRTRRVLGLEALLRWNHPVHGVIPPAQFLPLIEHTALSAKVGDWVMQQGIEQLAKWQRAGLDLTLSINVSARHLQEPLFAERLTALLDRHQTPVSRRLILEVLETAALADIDHTGNLMQQCQEMGVRFALDDFGTGYSTLTYLKRLPFDMLKVDRSFVHNMLSDKQDMAIVEGIIGLSHTFGCSLVAEGVETAEQARHLLSLGCEIGQGNGIAPAMPAQDVAQWVQNYRGAPLEASRDLAFEALS
jgi:diguanylate cyclase (GGDEF)-like protein/PAS domain S-box-containing protein